MKVVIAEKPSVAREIADVIGAKDKINGDYYSGNGYCVTWLYGHLLELVCKSAPKEWKVDTLPILPDRFDLEPIPKSDGSIAHRIDVVRELFNSCQSIVVATDAGREGELIFRNLYKYLKCNKPFERLWISSLTYQAIDEGMRHLYNGHDFDNLAIAAEQRSKADWLVGINATRAMTCMCGAYSVVLSLGRVQTAVLAMICRRFIHNVNFVSNPYWYIEGESKKDGTGFRFRGIDTYDNVGDCSAVADDVVRGGVLTVADVDTQRKTDAPPLLHDLGSLQKMASVRFDFSPTKTTALAQSLYEKRITTYPRTGSRYLSADVFAEVPKYLEKLAEDETFHNACVALLAMRDSDGEVRLNQRCVNPTKLTDHHAIIITGNDPKKLKSENALTDDEWRIYDLIATRFIEAFFPDAIYDVTKVKFEGGARKTVFEAKGRREIFAGWKSVTQSEAPEVELSDADAIEINQSPLPSFAIGDKIPVGDLEIVEDCTKPKPLLTEATLLSMMENAGRGNDDKAVMEALKDVGIGTPATRSEIIDILFTRNYIEKRGKKLIPTKIGISLFTAVQHNDLVNVDLTARWEMALTEIENGTLKPEVFDREIREFTRKTTEEILTGKNLSILKNSVKEEEIPCPKCGSPIRITEYRVVCTNKECGYSILRTIARKKLREESIVKLMKNRETGRLEGFINREGKTFAANVILKDNGETELQWVSKSSNRKHTD